MTARHLWSSGAFRCALQNLAYDSGQTMHDDVASRRHAVVMTTIFGARAPGFGMTTRDARYRDMTARHLWSSGVFLYALQDVM